MTASNEQNFEWLVIFLVYNNNYYDKDSQDTKDINTMKAQAKYILNQIRDADYSDQVMTLFVEAQIVEHKENPWAALSILWKKPGTWLSAYDKTWHHSDTVDILTNKVSFKKILDKIKKTYTAKKYLIVTAGHGSVVGVNYYIPELVQEINTPVSLLGNREVKDIPKDNNSHVSISRFDGNIKLENGRSLLFLSNEEIDETIREVFKDKKVDVLAMYNCIMQNVFTQYALRRSVDWLVAPLSGICIPGYNYKDILNGMANNPQIDAAGVAALFISTTRDTSDYDTLKGDIEGTWKFTATKLHQHHQDLLQQYFDETFSIIDHLSESSDEIINIINEVIKYLFSYSRYCLSSIQIFDLGSFLASLSENISGKDIYSSLQSSIQQLSACLKTINNGTFVFTGHDFYNSGSGISFFDTTKNNKDQIANIGILFPINTPDSNILCPMYNTKNYDINKKGNDEYSIPSFLTSSSYAKVLNKIHALPPMDL